MSDLYDIFFAGKIVDGFDESSVRENVARLFKANPATVEKLFSGKPQLIKRGVEKQAAIKYKAAMQKAGAVPLIRAHGAEKPAAATAPEPAPAPAPAPKEQTMAERLAALTGEPAPGAETPEAPFATASSPAAAPAATSAEADGFSLAPAGSDVLREDERAAVEELDIDTSAIHLAPEFSEPEVAVREEPPAPDTSHMSMGEVGDDIPTLHDAVLELDPDTSHLSMGEVGEDIPHLEDDREPVSVDTSAIDLAPEGSDVLEEAYRKKDEPEAPDTSHIKLASTFDTPG